VVSIAPHQAMQLKTLVVLPSDSASSSGELVHDVTQSTLQTPVKVEDRKSSRELSKVLIYSVVLDCVPSFSIN
jgi:hypothetical protein